MTDGSGYAELAEVAARTAYAVGDQIAVGDVAVVTMKQGRANFATAADHTAEATTLALLREATPDVPVIAEESATSGARVPARAWIVDPIDGTLNFSRGVPFYCVAIAYVEQRRTRAAAVYAPRLGELFVAHEGGGATLNGAPITVADPRALAECFVAAGLAYGATARRGSTFVALNKACARLRVIGSAALEMCYVGAGRLDLFVHGALSPWDIAAPWLVVREAGGAIFDRDAKRAADALASRVVVGHPRVVREAVARIPELTASRR